MVCLVYQNIECMLRPFPGETVPTNYQYLTMNSTARCLQRRRSTPTPSTSTSAVASSNPEPASNADNSKPTFPHPIIWLLSQTILQHRHSKQLPLQLESPFFLLDSIRWHPRSQLRDATSRFLHSAYPPTTLPCCFSGHTRSQPSRGATTCDLLPYKSLVIRSGRVPMTSLFARSRGLRTRCSSPPLSPISAGSGDEHRSAYAKEQRAEGPVRRSPFGLLT